MSRRGPDPKELRASLVDSGWSTAPPPAEVELVPAGAATDERRLPNYEDMPQAPAVTRVDNDIQARLQAMTRASLADGQHPPLPMPPPPPTRPPPPSLPPPPRPSAAPPAPSNAPLPSFESPPTDPQVPLPSYATQLRNSDSEPVETTEVQSFGAVLPSSQPPALVPPRAPPVPLGLSPSMPAAPSLLAALRQRVRFAGGEVPLWSLLAPMVLLLVLGSAFVAAGISGAEASAAAPGSDAAPSADAAPVATPAVQPSAIAAAAEAPPTAATQAPALPASAADAEALEARRAEELSKDEALTVAAARRQREIARVAVLRQKLTRDPGLFKDAATLAELRRAAEDPLTAPDALSAMAEAPGPLSADLLYEMWTGTVARNSATELARSLVFSKEVRAKASPELAIALELRIAETCEQNKALLPKVIDQGDRRSLALLAKLSRRFGCGANKRQDCYPCLRDDKLVDDAMVAVKKRREPKPFSGK